MNPADRATHVLNEVLPAMRANGCVVITINGPLHVPPGREAEQLADLLAHFQQLALIRAQCAEQQQAQPSATPAEGERDEMGFLLQENIIGQGWVPPVPGAHRPAELPCRADSGERKAAPQSQLPDVLSQLGATPATPGSRQ